MGTHPIFESDFDCLTDMGEGCCGGGGGGHGGPQRPAMNEEQEKIAKWVRWNVKTKNAPAKGGEKVDWFNGQSAVDKLMESDFHKKIETGKETPIVPDRDTAIALLTFFMRLRLFYRGEKEYRPKKNYKKVHDSDGETEDENEEKKVERRKRKFRLDLHDDQTFVDSPDAIYMWRYEATHPYTWLGGTLVIIIGFLGVLYTLWPSQLRGGVYYLSWGGLGFVGFVIVLAILRTILFALIWLFSGGKHHLWIFPNLTEDVGPIESFMPLYTYKYTGPKEKKSKKKKKKALAENSEEGVENAVEGGDEAEPAEPKSSEEKKDD